MATYTRCNAISAPLLAASACKDQSMVVTFCSLFGCASPQYDGLTCPGCGVAAKSGNGEDQKGTKNKLARRPRVWSEVDQDISEPDDDYLTCSETFSDNDDDSMTEQWHTNSKKKISFCASDSTAIDDSETTHESPTSWKIQPLDKSACIELGKQIDAATSCDQLSDLLQQHAKQFNLILLTKALNGICMLRLRPSAQIMDDMRQSMMFHLSEKNSRVVTEFVWSLAISQVHCPELTVDAATVAAILCKAVTYRSQDVPTALLSLAILRVDDRSLFQHLLGIAKANLRSFKQGDVSVLVWALVFWQSNWSAAVRGSSSKASLLHSRHSCSLAEIVNMVTNLESFHGETSTDRDSRRTLIAQHTDAFSWLAATPSLQDLAERFLVRAPRVLFERIESTANRKLQCFDLEKAAGLLSVLSTVTPLGAPDRMLAGHCGDTIRIVFAKAVNSSKVLKPQTLINALWCSTVFKVDDADLLVLAGEHEHIFSSKMAKVAAAPRNRSKLGKAAQLVDNRSKQRR